MKDQFYQSIIYKAPLGYAYHRMIYDLAGKPKDYVFLDVNDEFVGMMGITRDDIIGKKVTELIPDIANDPFDWIGVYGQVAAGCEVREFEQYSNALKRWYEVKAFSTDEDTFVTFFLDITDRVMTEEAIKENNEKLKITNQELDRALEAALTSSQAKNEFLANMTHEIRTPMNAIMGFSQLAMEQKQKEDMELYLKKIQKSSKRLMGIIDDILDYSRIESGEMVIEDRALSVGQILQDVVNTYSYRIQKKGLALETSLDPDIPLTLLGDPLRVRQVLMNLMSNAVKFTEEGEIRIHVNWVKSKTRQRLLQFSVTDTGIGIAETDLNRLFMPFVQADGSITRRYEGTGLGLSISRQLLELMGGRLSVESTPGSGSAFTFFLPVEEMPLRMEWSDDPPEAMQVPGKQGKDQVKHREIPDLESIRWIIGQLQRQMENHEFLDDRLVGQLGVMLSGDMVLNQIFERIRESLDAFEYEKGLEDLLHLRRVIETEKHGRCD